MCFVFVFECFGYVVLCYVMFFPAFLFVFFFSPLFCVFTYNGKIIKKFKCLIWEKSASVFFQLMKNGPLLFTS